VKEYQQRVIKEKRELDDRLDKLKTFFGVGRFTELDCDEQDRMRKQAEVMGEYSKILGKRIKAFQVVAKEMKESIDADVLADVKSQAMANKEKK